MSESGRTIPLIEACLVRLAAGDNNAWDELITHAFNRLLARCRSMVYKELPKPHPLITANAVLAEVYMRLATAMQNDKVQPTTARAFFGLAARHIRWQILDMVGKPTPQPVDAEFFDALPDGMGVSTAVEEREKWRLLCAVVDALPDDERDVFDLLWIEGLSQYEAAELLDKTRNQVDTLGRKVKVKIGTAWKDFAPSTL